MEDDCIVIDDEESEGVPSVKPLPVSSTVTVSVEVPGEMDPLILTINMVCFFSFKTLILFFF